MDPVTHTLTGAAMARAGLARLTPGATITLLIAANIPDVDILAYVRGPEFALTFRRGWTHGVLALAIWPFIVAASVMLVARIRAFRRPRVHASPRFRPLVGVAALGVLTHPLLDWLNVYGLRWLMPSDGTWYYGDALFIADPWVWAVLAAGAWAGRRTGGRSARWALGAFGAYAAVMMAGSWQITSRAARALAADGPAPGRMLAAPEPLVPWRRWVVAEVPGGYRVGPGGAPADQFAFLPRGDAHPAAAVAAMTTRARWFLAWARFPMFRVGPDTVRILDARYAVDDDAPFGIVKIPRQEMRLWLRP